MTDNLRNRIAAAIYNENPYAWTPDQCDVAADAVIRELALTQQYLVDGIISDGEPRLWEVPCETRYATGWERFDG